MTKWQAFSAIVERCLARYRHWRARRIELWEDRYIIQYNKIIAEALAGVEESKRRRAKSRR